MEILGLGPDLILTVLFVIGWIVLMRFVLPKLGVSTWMGEACNVASPRDKEEQDWAEPGEEA